jgi:hypothetical protein
MYECYVGCWDREGRVEGNGGGATIPTARERGRGPAARAVRGAGNAGRGASPMAGKREGFFF